MCGFWAHDMNALPDETYRYRMTIHVANPFFRTQTKFVP